MIYITFLQYIWRKKSYIYFASFCDFLNTFCICSLRRMGKFRLVSRWEDFFFLFFLFLWGRGGGGGGGVRRLFRFLGDSPKGLRKRCISWGFPRWGIEWKIFFVFWAVALTIYLFIYLFIYYYYYYFWLALIRHIRFCWCELL